MPTRGLQLGSIAGAAIVVDTNILILAFYVLGSAFFDHGATALPAALSWLGALFTAVLLHEFGHAGVAGLLRIPSKMIVLTFFGGYVEFAFPPKKRWHDILVSAAGPLANLTTYALLVLLAAPIEASPPAVLRFADDLAYASLVLGAFNLLPGYPLDGGGILRAALSYFLTQPRARLIAGWSGFLIAAGVGIYAALGEIWWTLMIALVLGLNAWAEINRAEAAIKAARAQGVAPSTSNA